MSNLSQDAINALLDEKAKEEAAPLHTEDSSASAGPLLTDREIDILGETGNICMGASSTAMYTLLNQRVHITTPRVDFFTADEIRSMYKSPLVVVEVEYIDGIEGKNLLVLKEYDAAVITDILMGGDGKPDEENIELNEIHLSAISEVMNQMIGAAATAMSNMLGIPINISTPKTTRIGIDGNIGVFLGEPEMVVKIGFDMEIETILQSEIMQIMTVSTAKGLADQVYESLQGDSSAPVAPPPPPQPEQTVSPQTVSQAAAERSEPAEMKSPVHTVSVSPVSYTAFDEPPPAKNKTEIGGSIDIISDIPLNVSVELGHTQKNISDILNYGMGSVIVLDKQAGDLVEIMVNGKLIARGEVVIIDENYGVRITEVVSPGGRFH